MEVKEIIEKIESKKEFKEWKDSSPESYLTSLFTIIDRENQETWQAGYYNSVLDKITTVTLNQETIEFQEEQEIAKFDTEKVDALKLEKVEIDFQHALEIAETLQTEKYPKETPIKKIVILQNMKPYGNIWNISYFTASMSVLNIKIDAKEGIVLEDSAKPFSDFAKPK